MTYSKSKSLGLECIGYTLTQDNSNSQINKGQGVAATRPMSFLPNCLRIWIKWLISLILRILYSNYLND